jgi:hypothetical protein
MRATIDDALTGLAAGAPHPGLTGLEDRVLDAIAAQPAGARIGAGATLMAVGLALTIGVFSNVVAPAGGRSVATVSPVGAPSALAPSMLLGENR